MGDILLKHSRERVSRISVLTIADPRLLALATHWAGAIAPLLAALSVSDGCQTVG